MPGAASHGSAPGGRFCYSRPHFEGPDWAVLVPEGPLRRVPQQHRLEPTLDWSSPDLMLFQAALWPPPYGQQCPVHGGAPHARHEHIPDGWAKAAIAAQVAMVWPSGARNLTVLPTVRVALPQELPLSIMCYVCIDGGLN